MLRPDYLLRLFGKFLVGCWLLCLASCTTQLAPSYNKAIADGLVTINQQVMTLLASVSEGTVSANFSERENNYNRLIGNLDALVLQAKSRPYPQNNVNTKIKTLLGQRGIILDESNEAPSAAALEQLSITMTKMRDTDKKQGVTAFEVKAFKGMVVIYLDQALTYENFLSREEN